jgi:hypothetical protein
MAALPGILFVLVTEGIRLSSFISAQFPLLALRFTVYSADSLNTHIKPSEGFVRQKE